MRRLLAMVVVLAWASPADASTLELFGYGGRSPGMVGLGVASSTDFDSVYLNPAGLGQVKRTRLSLGALHGDFHLELDGNQVDGVDPAQGTITGAVAPLRLGGALKDRVAIGLGIFVPTEAIARARWPLPGQPNFALLESRAQVVAFSLGVGVQINERWSAGLAMLGLAGLGGNIFISADAAGQFVAQSEQTLIARAAPVLGVRYDRSDKGLRFGLTFRDTFDATYNVVIENTLESELPLTVPTLTVAGTAQYDPLTVAFETSWQASKSLSLHGQVAYYRWSAFPAPTKNPVDGKPDPADPGFSDTVVPRLGAELTTRAGAAELTYRGGYSFVMSPAPEMDGQQSLLDNHRHVASLGFSIGFPEWKAPIRFDLWTQGHLLMSRSHRKDPANFGPDEELPFDQIETGGRILVGGITMGVGL